jgi:hypothetical protein
MHCPLQFFQVANDDIELLRTMSHLTYLLNLSIALDVRFAEPASGKTVLLNSRHAGFSLDRTYEYEGISAVRNKLVLVTCENVGVNVCKAEVNHF